MEAGDVDGARRRHAELAALASELRMPLYQHAALAWRGVWAQLAGRFEEAERMAREGLRLAERAGAPDARSNFTAQLLPLMREQGRLPELLGELHGLDPHALAWGAIAPLAHLDAGDYDAAADGLRRRVRVDPRRAAVAARDRVARRGRRAPRPPRRRRGAARAAGSLRRAARAGRLRRLLGRRGPAARTAHGPARRAAPPAGGGAVHARGDRRGAARRADARRARRAEARGIRRGHGGSPPP